MLKVGEWTEINEGDRSRLLGKIEVLGVSMHVDAFEVWVNSDGIQNPVNEEDWQEDFDEWCIAAEPDGHFETATIDGREYVLFASPYC